VVREGGEGGRGRGGGGGRHAALVAAGILLSRVFGYVRQRVMAHYIGNSGAAADAIGAALKIPNVIRNLLGEGTLLASFIPVYAALNEREDKGPARALAGTVLGLLLLASGVLAVLGVLFAPAITTAVAAGFDEPRRRLTIALVRILFPMTGLMVVSAWCLGVLNTHRRFFLPYAAPVVWNVCGIAALLAAGTWLISPQLPVDEQLNRLAFALAWGLVVGSVVQVAVQLPACWRALHGIPLGANPAVFGVRDVLTAWLPVVLGMGVSQISAFVDTQLGSLAGPSGVSSLTYAQLIQFVAIGMFGTSVAAVSLPDLSRDAAGATPNDQLRARIALAFRRITFFVVPASFLFAAFGPLLIAALYQTGRFSSADSLEVGGVLAAYGIGLLGQACVKLFASGFYALRDTRTPVKIAAFSTVLSSVLAYLLMRRFGVAGIALGSSIGGWVNVVLHLRDLDKRIGTVMRGVDWLGFGASLVAAAAASGVGALATLAVAEWPPIPLAVVTVAIFAMVYGSLTLVLRHPDARRLWKFLG
jgi:putative peptidoglycan lipid II flippase